MQWRIVDEDNNVVDELQGLTEREADEALCNCLNQGGDCYLQEMSNESAR